MKIKPIPSLIDWQKNTSAGRLSQRGAQMQAVDELIGKFASAKSGDDRKHVLTKLERAFSEYRMSHIRWRTEPRNQLGTLTDLDESLTLWKHQMMPQLPDPRATDAAFGRNGATEAEHVHSRLGVIWLFSKIAISDDPEPPATADKEPSAAERSWYEKIWDAITNYCRSIWKSIKAQVEKSRDAVSWEAIKGYPQQGREAINAYLQKNSSLETADLPSSLFKLVKLLIKELLAKIAGPIMDVATGLVKAFSAATDRFQVWQASHDVNISAGTPATVVKTIESAMDRSIGKGLATALKGGVGMIPVVGSFATLIAAALDKIYMFMMKRWEKTRLRAFFADAKQLWTEREQPEPFHARAEGFNKWFKSYVEDVPALAILTLNSGCCGNKMVWLNMFNTSALPIQQGQFDAGVKFLDEHLIPYGTRYLNEYNIQFTSTDSMAQAFIKNSMEYGVITRKQRVFRFIESLSGGDPKPLIQRMIP